MDQCDLDQAGKKAGKLRERIEVSRPNDLVLTTSIGVAQLDGEGDSFDELLKRADAAVYRAKEQGRNRIVPESEL